MKRRLKEEVGVPQGIIKSAKELFDKIIYHVKSEGFTEPIKDNLSNTFYITTNIQISDLEIKTVMFKINLDFYNIDKIQMIKASFSSPTRTDYSKFVFITQKYVNFTDLKLTLALPSGQEFTTKDITDFMVKNSTSIISTIAHELKHAYDAFKKDTESFSSRIDYAAITNFGAFGLESVKEFFYYLYLATDAEVLVKPTEVASRVESGEVNKKEFLNFLLSDKTYHEFSYMFNITYESLFQSVMEEKDEIIDLFQRSGLSVPNDEKVLFEKLLEYLFIDFVNNKIEILNDMLVENPIEAVFGFTDSKRKFFEKMATAYSKYSETPTKFFKNEIKRLNFIGEKMIKKLGKLYVLAKDDTTQSNIIKRIYNKVNR